MKPMITAGVLALGLSSLAACGSSGGGGADSFCDNAREADRFSTEFSELDPDAPPDQVRALVDDYIAAAEAATDAAPAAIEGAADTATTGLKEVRDILRDNDFDLVRTFEDADFASLTEDERFATAGDELDAFLEAECGIPADTDNDSATTDASASGGSTPPDTSTGGTATPSTDDDLTFPEELAERFAAEAGITLTDEQRTCVGEGFVRDVGLGELAEAAGAENIEPGLLAKVFAVLDTCGVEVPAG